jgi:LysM repeat protein
VCAVLVVALLVLGAFLFGRATAAAVGPGRPPAEQAVTVQPGDTLWDIARRVAPRSDPRLEVARLMERNGLVTAVVRPGQRLVIPPGAPP